MLSTSFSMDHGAVSPKSPIKLKSDPSGKIRAVVDNSFLRKREEPDIAIIAKRATSERKKGDRVIKRIDLPIMPINISSSDSKSLNEAGTQTSPKDFNDKGTQNIINQASLGTQTNVCSNTKDTQTYVGNKNEASQTIIPTNEKGTQNTPILSEKATQTYFQQPSANTSIIKNKKQRIPTTFPGFITSQNVDRPIFSFGVTGNPNTGEALIGATVSFPFGDISRKERKIWQLQKRTHQLNNLEILHRLKEQEKDTELLKLYETEILNTLVG